MKPNPLKAPTLPHLPTQSKHTPLAVEIQAPYGLFSRSDSLPNAVSHPIPTYGAAVNILKHIFTFRDDTILLLAAEILSPTAFTTKKFNLKGPERKRGVEGSQVTWQILTRPRFRLTFDLLSKSPANAGRAINTALKKIKSGSHKQPFMGVSDFLVRFSLPTEDTPIPENHQIEWMVTDPKELQFLPPFKVINGVGIYPQETFQPKL